MWRVDPSASTTDRRETSPHADSSTPLLHLASNSGQYPLTSTHAKARLHPAVGLHTLPPHAETPTRTSRLRHCQRAIAASPRPHNAAHRPPSRPDPEQPRHHDAGHARPSRRARTRTREAPGRRGGRTPALKHARGPCRPSPHCARDGGRA